MASDRHSETGQPSVTAFPHEVAEAALAHVIGDKVEAAYRRGDLFEKRRRLMEAWAAYCETVVTEGRLIRIEATKHRNRRP
jgi:hypothetical protein